MSPSRKIRIVLRNFIDFIDKSISINHKNTIVEYSRSRDIFLYFLKYNTIHQSDEYYKTDEGFQERAEWCEFLNERDIFKYKKMGKFEVCASLDNLYAATISELYINLYKHLSLLLLLRLIKILSILLSIASISNI